MKVATFGPSTGWAGKTMDYENGVFTLEGHGPITAADVLGYDRQGHLEWACDGLREWVSSLAAAPPAPPAAGQAPPRAIGTGLPTRPAKKGLPGWAIALIAVAVIVLIPIVFFAAKASQDDASMVSAVTEGIHSIQIGAQSYAVDYNDAYPDPALMNEVDMLTYLSFWPENPYTGGPMTQGTGPGQFTYQLTPDGGFIMIGYGEDGPVITVP